MARTLTDNEAMAMGYMTMFMQARLALNKTNVSLSWILQNNPLLQYASSDERNEFRLGINALVEHKLLIQDDQGLWLSNLGEVFNAYCTAVTQSSPTLEEDIKDHPILLPILASIAAEPKFNPPKEASHRQVPPTSPNRKASSSAYAKSSSAQEAPGFWNIWTIIMLIMVSLGFLKVITAAFK